MENCLAISNKYTPTLWPFNSTPRHSCKRKEKYKSYHGLITYTRYDMTYTRMSIILGWWKSNCGVRLWILNHYINCFFHENPKLETTQISRNIINNMPCIQQNTYSSIRRIEPLKELALVNCKNVLLCERSIAHKNKYCMIPIYDILKYVKLTYDLKKKRKMVLWLGE